MRKGLHPPDRLSGPEAHSFGSAILAGGSYAAAGRGFNGRSRVASRSLLRPPAHDASPAGHHGELLEGARCAAALLPTGPEEVVLPAVIHGKVVDSAGKLLDLMIPEMDGFTFLQELRARPGCRDLPVIVITAKHLTDDDRRRLNGEAARILQKGTTSTGNLPAEVRSLLAAL